MPLPIAAAATVAVVKGGLPAGWSSLGYSTLALSWSVSQVLLSMGSAATRNPLVATVGFVGSATISFFALPIILAGCSFGTSTIIGMSLGFAAYGSLCGCILLQ